MPKHLSHFRVSVLGPFALERDGRALETGSWQRRVGALLRMLAVAPDHRRAREEIIDAFWPDAEVDAGARNLRVVLHMLRRALGGDHPSPLLSEGGWISLNPAFAWEIDLERFLDLAQRPSLPDLETAVALYRGEVLPEDRYEDWAAPIREQLRQTWRDLLLRLASTYRSRGDLNAAASWLIRVLESDPLDEAALRDLLTVLVESGRRPEAERRFRAFRQKLRAELDLVPEPETAAVLETARPSLAAGTLYPRPFAPRYPLFATQQLVGRDEAVRIALRELLRAVPPTSADTAHLILFTGESGMGKTRMLAEVALRARDAEMLVLAGGCYEQEGRLPYGPIHDALRDYALNQPVELLRQQFDGILGDLLRIVPELRRAGALVADRDDDDPRLRLFTAVAEALRRISQQLPVVLLLDDLHWSDDSTLQLMHFLLRQPGLGQVLIAATYRQDEVEEDAPLIHLVERAVESGMASLVQLDALSESEIQRLLDARFGQCSPELVRAIYDRSGGNPVFSVQIMRLLQTEDKLVRMPFGYTLEPGTVIDTPREVHATVARRLRHLEAETHDLLVAGAVLGREFSQAALEAVWDGDRRSLTRALRRATAARILWERNGRYTFRHPLLHEVIGDEIPGPLRATLHARAGMALEGLYGARAENHAAELARHFVEGGPQHAERAVRYLVAAADAAERALAFEEAATLLERAVPLAPPQLRAHVYQRIGTLYTGLQRFEAALRHFDHALHDFRQSSDLQGEIQAALSAARAHARRGTAEAGIALLSPLLSRFNGEPEAAAVMLQMAALFFELGQYDEQLKYARQARQIGNAMEGQEADALCALAELAKGEHGGAESFSSIAATLSDPRSLPRLLRRAAEACERRGDLRAARAWAQRALHEAQRPGNTGDASSIATMLGRLSLLIGELDEAERYMTQALQHSRSLHGVAAAPLFGMGMVARARGDWQVAREHLEASADAAERAGDRRTQVSALLMLAELDLLEHGEHAAAARLEHVEDSRAQVMRTRMTLETGPATPAHTALTSDARIDELCMDALQAVQAGREGDADRCFQAALEQTESSPLLQARVLETWGTVSTGKRPSLLAEALQRYQQLSATRDVERVAQRLQVRKGGP